MTLWKIHIAAIALLGMVALFAASTVQADNRQVWRDRNGNIVHSRISGTCVRQNSVIEDPCAPVPQYVKSASIAREDRTVYFDFNKTDLTEESRARLNALAEKMRSASNIEGAEIAGYADRIGSVSYNDALSKKRATIVRDYLISRNVVNANVVKTRWVGKRQPSTQCPDSLPRAELIQCLHPDRKVQVDIVYRVETMVPAPQIPQE